MLEWLEGVAGPEYVPAILWTAAALVALVVVLLIIKLIRRMTFGTYVAGGRNRKTRLAVMDATAVDSHRRLVLVRRDDIEHLLLIGGPTDVVVERDIRLSAPRRPVEGQQTIPPQRPRQPAQAPGQTRQAAPLPPPAQAAQPPRQRDPLPPLAPSLQNQRHPAPPAPRPPVRPAAPADDLIDEELMRDLDFSLADEAPPQRQQSLDDEMAKLLGELSNHKK